MAKIFDSQMYFSSLEVFCSGRAGWHPQWQSALCHICNKFSIRRTASLEKEVFESFLALKILVCNTEISCLLEVYSKNRG